MLVVTRDGRLREWSQVVSFAAARAEVTQRSPSPGGRGTLRAFCPGLDHKESLMSLHALQPTKTSGWEHKNENVTLIKLRFEKKNYVLYYRLINRLLVVHIIHSTKFFII